MLDYDEAANGLFTQLGKLIKHCNQQRTDGGGKRCLREWPMSDFQRRYVEEMQRQHWARLQREAEVLLRCGYAPEELLLISHIYEHPSRDQVVPVSFVLPSSQD